MKKASILAIEVELSVIYGAHYPNWELFRNWEPLIKWLVFKWLLRQNKWSVLKWLLCQNKWSVLKVQNKWLVLKVQNKWSIGNNCFVKTSGRFESSKQVVGLNVQNKWLVFKWLLCQNKWSVFNLSLMAVLRYLL